MRLYDAVGDRAALAPLVDASYADWNGGKVTRTRPADLIAIATAVRLDGNWKDANDVLRDAVRADPRATAANLDWGDVLLREAQRRRRRGRRSRTCSRSTPTTPTPTSAWRASRSPIATTAPPRWRRSRRALAVNPAHAGALALRAAARARRRELGGGGGRRRRHPPHEPAATSARRASRRRPRCCSTTAPATSARVPPIWPSAPNDGAFFAFVAEALTHHRRYDDARDVAREGIAADPDDAGCLAVLAMTLLRLGDEDAGLDALRRAWKRDPYDVRTYNLLNLFEKAIPARYTTISSAHLRFRVPTAGRAADRGGRRALPGRALPRTTSPATASSPAGPMMFELYGDPHEFAVRTDRPAGDRRRRRLLRPRHHLAGADQPRLQLGDGAGARARARVRDRAVAVARAALVHRGAVRGGDRARCGPSGRATTTSPCTRASPRRAADAAVAVERVHHRARATRRRGRTRRRRLAVDFLERRFGFPALREALVAFGRGEARGRRARQDDGDVGARRWSASSAPSSRDGSRATTSNICRRSPRAPPPRGVSRPRPTNVRDWAARGLGALRAGDVDEANARRSNGRAPCRSRRPTTRPTRCSWRARSRSRAATPTPRSRRSRACSTSDRRPATATTCACVSGWRRFTASAPPPPRRTCAAPSSSIRSRVEPHALLAELYKSQQRTADRLAALAAALRLDPQTDRVAKEVVLGEAKAGRSARVAELAPIAIFIDPANADLHAALGRALAATGKTAAGAAALERALLFGPQSPALLHLELAALYDTLGDRKRAAAHRAAGGAAGSGR